MVEARSQSVCSSFPIEAANVVFVLQMIVLIIIGVRASVRCVCVRQMRAPTANTLRRQSSMAEKSPNRRRRRRINEESDK